MRYPCFDYVCDGRRQEEDFACAELRRATSQSKKRPSSIIIAQTHTHLRAHECTDSNVARLSNTFERDQVTDTMFVLCKCHRRHSEFTGRALLEIARCFSLVPIPPQNFLSISPKLIFSLCIYLSSAYLSIFMPPAPSGMRWPAPQGVLSLQESPAPLDALPPLPPGETPPPSRPGPAHPLHFRPREPLRFLLAFRLP